MNPNQNIATAQSEYYRRPADERFSSVAALQEHAQHQKEVSREKTINAKELRAVELDSKSIALVGPQGNPAKMTHWSFGQLCRSIGAPAGYLRDLPAELCARNVNHGLQHTPPATDLRLLLQAPNGNPHPTVRACTSDTYGRVWDADLYSAVLNNIMGRGDFMLPPTGDGKPAGAYRSDRDSFLIIVNGGSIVQDPSLVNSTFTRPTPRPGAANEASVDPSGLYRGLMIRNSEVGASSITIDQILFRYICGNHMLWGAMVDKTFSRRHVGKDSALRDTIREITSIAFHWTNAGASRDESIIKTLINHEIATTRSGVVDELRKIGFGKKDAEAAYDAAEIHEPGCSPRSFWGIAQGATRLSQASGYQDERYSLDQLAADVLKRGVKQYATV